MALIDWFLMVVLGQDVLSFQIVFFQVSGYVIFWELLIFWLIDPPGR